MFRRQEAKVMIADKLIVDDVEIDQLEYIKFLGVVIDQNLTFHKHIQYIKEKNIKRCRHSL